MQATADWRLGSDYGLLRECPHLKNRDMGHTQLLGLGHARRTA